MKYSVIFLVFFFLGYKYFDAKELVWYTTGLFFLTLIAYHLSEIMHTLREIFESYFDD